MDGYFGRNWHNPPPQQSDWPWDDVVYAAPILTYNNSLIRIDHPVQASGDTDIRITKFDATGELLWESTYNGPASGNDYGISVITDNSGNILVLGAVSTSNLTSDFVVLKYNSNGQLLWSFVSDGGNNQLDLPTDIESDDSGNIYFCGGSVSTSSLSDWRIYKLSPNGDLQWSNSYNYVNLHDMPASITSISSGDVVIAGFSASATDSWDALKLTFSNTDGSLQTEKRTNIPQLSATGVALLTKDNNSGAFYLAGTSKGSVADSTDMLLIQLDANFNINWTQTIDAEGLYDEARALRIAPTGDVVLAGNSTKVNGGQQITLAKFSALGEPVFYTSYQASPTYGLAEVTKMEINQEGDIFLAATVQNEDSKDLGLLIYSADGRLKAENLSGIEPTSNERSLGLALSGDDKVFVNGKSEGSVTKSVTAKYELLKLQNTIVEVNGLPHHKGGEILVQFYPEYVDTAFVNNRDLFYGDIYDALDSTAAEAINARIDLRGAVFVKIFPRLTTFHSYSITRLGDTIPLPPFWAGFKIILSPSQSPESTVDLLEQDSLHVKYAELNYVGQLDVFPNDPLFNLQTSLFSPNSEADINVEPAWDLETGRSYVKVGVYDVKIFWQHEDFGGSTFEASQIAGGWDYVNHTSISNASLPSHYHGTSVAGIIGALRDNELGIAGIAGGGMNAQNETTSGVQLFSMANGESFPSGDELIEDADMANAIVEGAMYVPSADPPGYGLHIQNHSWGQSDYSTFLADAVRTAWRNQCILVAARGNFSSLVGDEQAISYPACLPDPLIINVGGSGTNGAFENGGSLFGQGVDVIAPFSSDNVHTTSYSPDDPDNTSLYGPFSGTSASAPHVAGVAALLYSLHNTQNPVHPQPNNLAPEDVEYLLQAFATDIAGFIELINYPIGYDDWSGWGRVNAFESLSRVQAPEWRVFHNGEPISTEEEFLGQSDPGIGGLVFKKFKITQHYHDIFPEGTHIEAAWPRFSSTFGSNMDHPAPDWPEEWAEFQEDINGNEAFITMVTYKVETWNSYTNELLYETPYQTAYSLLLHNTTPTSTNDEGNLSKRDITISPNPTTGEVSILCHDLTDIRYLRLIDAKGEIVEEWESSQIQENGMSGLNLNISDQAPGVYFLQFVLEEDVFSAKIIKH